MKLSLQSLNKPKVIYPTLFALLIASVYLYTLKEGEKTLRINTQKQLAETTQKKIAVETKLTETTQVKRENRERARFRKGEDLHAGKTIR